MVCRNTDITRISNLIRIKIAKDFLRRKKQWDITHETRVVIENLISLAESLTESAEADKLGFRDAVNHVIKETDK